MDQDGARQPLPDRRHLPGPDPALLAGRPPHRLHGLSGRGRRAIYVVDLDTGRDGLLGDFPGHDLRPALRAGRPQPAADRWPRTATPTSILGHRQPARHAADQRRRDRHLALVLARRQPDRVQLRPRRPAAALRHGPQRRRRHPDQLRRRPLRQPGLVAARRPDRVHGDQGRHVQHRRDAAGRQRRAADDPQQPRREPDLGAQRPGDHVQPPRRRAGRRRLFTIDVSGYNEREVSTPTDASDPDWSPTLP